VLTQKIIGIQKVYSVWFDLISLAFRLQKRDVFLVLVIIIKYFFEAHLGFY